MFTNCFWLGSGLTCLPGSTRFVSTPIDLMWMFALEFILYFYTFLDRFLLLLILTFMLIWCSSFFSSTSRSLLLLKFSCVFYSSYFITGFGFSLGGFCMLMVPILFFLNLFGSSTCSNWSILCRVLFTEGNCGIDSVLVCTKCENLLAYGLLLNFVCWSSLFISSFPSMKLSLRSVSDSAEFYLLLI